MMSNQYRKMIILTFLPSCITKAKQFLQFIYWKIRKKYCKVPKWPLFKIFSYFCQNYHGMTSNISVFSHQCGIQKCTSILENKINESIASCNTFQILLEYLTLEVMLDRIGCCESFLSWIVDIFSFNYFSEI